jgi:predicted aldo/keto reductase-like oxidoreductase
VQRIYEYDLYSTFRVPAAGALAQPSRLFVTGINNQGQGFANPLTVSETNMQVGAIAPGNETYEVSAIAAEIFGAAALARADEGTAERVLDLLLRYDVNHIDTAARYGESEVHVGRWMERHRDRFFLATKTGERDYAGARDGIARSLERLRTDCIDMIQLHALVHPDEWERALGPGGACR